MPIQNHELPIDIDGTFLPVFSGFLTGAAEVGAEWRLPSLQLRLDALVDWATATEDDAVTCGWVDTFPVDALNSEGSFLLEILLAAFISTREGMVNLEDMLYLFIQYFILRIKRADTNSRK